MRISKKKERQKQKQSNSRANGASIFEGVEGTLFLWREFFGSWFSKLGGAGILNFISFPLAPRRSGRRRRDGVAEFRLLF